MRSPNICGVILAAGDSTRMGRDKAMLPLPGATAGDTLLSAALDSLLPATELVIVVSGRNSQSIAPTVYTRSATLIENTTPEAGQFSSLRLGLREVLNRGRDAAFVALVDRPAPSSNTIERLRTEFLDALEQGYWAVVPEHKSQHGHPILLAREMIEALLRAPADSNCGEVLRANVTRIRYVSVEDPNIVLNINTPEEYQSLVQPSVEK